MASSDDYFNVEYSSRFVNFKMLQQRQIDFAKDLIFKYDSGTYSEKHAKWVKKQKELEEQQKIELNNLRIELEEKEQIKRENERRLQYEKDMLKREKERKEDRNQRIWKKEHQKKILELQTQQKRLREEQKMLREEEQKMLREEHDSSGETYCIERKCDDDLSEKIRVQKALAEQRERDKQRDEINEICWGVQHARMQYTQTHTNYVPPATVQNIRYA